MTLTDFHAFCRSIKAALDDLPEGSTGVLVLISCALHGALVRLGVDRLAARILGPTVAATLLARLPTLAVSTLWDWLTTGAFTADGLARGVVAGLLGPMLLGLAKRPPPGPQSGVSATPSTSASVSPLSLSSHGVLPERVADTLFVDVTKMVAIALLVQGCGLPAPRLTPEQSECQSKARLGQTVAFGECLARDRTGGECTELELKDIEHAYCVALVTCVDGEETECEK